MKTKAVLSVLFAALLTLSLVSCGSSDYAKDTAAQNSSYAAYADAAYDYDYGYYADAPEAAPSPEPTASTSSSSTKNDLSSRKIIRTAYLNFDTTEYDAFLNALNACVAGVGGYVESSETYGGGIYSSRYNRSASVTARIPADRYDAFMEQAGKLGALTYRSESQDDVTMQYVDVESHIRALETEYQALIDILEKAESLEDVILLQNRISEVNYELDSYKSQIRKYDDLISYCTVHVNVSEVWRETVPNEKTLTFGERIASGLKENLLDIGEDAGDFAVWFVTSLPYLLIWAVIIVALIFIIRALIRRNRKKKEQKMMEAYLRSQNDHEQKQPPKENP